MSPRTRTTVSRLGIFLAISIIASACGTTASKAPPATSGSTRQSSTGPVTVSGPPVCSTLAQATREFSGRPASTTPAALSNAYANLKAHEAIVERVAPASIRGDFLTLFKALNDFYGTLATVGYDYRRLSPTEAAKMAAATRGLGPASTAIQSYLLRNCSSTRKSGG